MQPGSILRGLRQVAEGLPIVSRHLEVMGQLVGDLGRLPRIQFFQRVADLLVKIAALDLVQTLVEILPEEIVAEKITGQAIRASIAHAVSADEAVLFIEFTTQSIHNCPRIRPLNVGKYLGRENLSFHAGDRQPLAKVVVKASQSRLYHAFNPWR
jgi:hypothetical protein